jgi:hypothetical protein
MLNKTINKFLALIKITLSLPHLTGHKTLNLSEPIVVLMNSFFLKLSLVNTLLLEPPNSVMKNGLLIHLKYVNFFLKTKLKNNF